jgi:hypothetical protein
VRLNLVFVDGMSRFEEGYSDLKPCQEGFIPDLSYLEVELHVHCISMSRKLLSLPITMRRDAQYSLACALLNGGRQRIGFALFAIGHNLLGILLQAIVV